VSIETPLIVGGHHRGGGKRLSGTSAGVWNVYRLAYRLD
jgi:hypothetical protein